jgi:hypothetical protein
MNIKYPETVSAGFPADFALTIILKVQADAVDVKPNPEWVPAALLSRVL